VVVYKQCLRIVEVECSRVNCLVHDVASCLCVKTAMKSTMPFVDRGDIEKVKLYCDYMGSWGEGCVCVLLALGSIGVAYLITDTF